MLCILCKMSEVEMCDKATRVWCCRIGLVLSISCVLLTMMFQIWSYYFSLVRDMDALTSSEPRLSALMSVCNEKIVSTWNVNCFSNETYWNCDSELNGSIFVDSSCSDWREFPKTECCRTMLWILPW